MLIQDLEQIKDFFARLDGPVVGVGMTAFSRIVPASFLPSYRIVCNQKTSDLPLLREKIPVFCFEETTGGKPFNRVANSFQLLSKPCVEESLNRQKDPKYLFLYQNYPELEEFSKIRGWKLLANPSQLRIRLGERSFFERVVSDLGFPKIPGGIFPWKTMAGWGYENWVEKLGPKFVVQLPEIQRGGGRGTFFVGSKGEYDALRKRLAKGVWRGSKLISVSVHSFIKGISASVAFCVTRNGVLISGLQKQLIDLSYCHGLDENGIFCGHVWGAGDTWPEAVLSEAQEQARKAGNHLASLGYKGIAGMDFIVQPEEGKVYPVEINPRLTGAFPVLSLLQLTQGIIPMEAFHLLEFLEMPYRIDVEDMNRQYAQPLNGSHLLVLRGAAQKANIFRPLRAGIWEYNPEKNTCSFLKESFDLREIQNQRQFIIADGPPDGMRAESGRMDPLHRLCRILFPYAIENEKGLREEVHAIVDWVQRQCMG